MAKTDAERQRDVRDRRRLERARAEIRDLVGETCACCGESNAVFLTRVGECVYCENCAKPTRLGLLCPHRGIGRRLR